jgi:hypothetical protein
VTQEAGSQAEAEAHVKRPVKINTEMKRNNSFCIAKIQTLNIKQ